MVQMELFDIYAEGKHNNLCKIEMLEIDLFDHLTVCNQMTDV